MLDPGRKTAGRPEAAPLSTLDCAPETVLAQPKTSARRWVVRVLVVAGLAVAIGTLPLQIFGERGLTQYRRLQVEHRELVVRNLRLARDIRQMELEVRRLRDDDVTLERAARDDLGMVRPGELIFVVDE